MTGWDPIKSAHGLEGILSPEHTSLVCQIARIASFQIGKNVFLMLFYLIITISFILQNFIVIIIDKTLEHRCRPFAGQIVTSRNKSK